MASSPQDPLWKRAHSILAEAERIEREFLRARPVPPSWAPAVDVLETRTEVFVLVALPGVDAEAIEIALQGPRMIIAGQRRVPHGLASAAVHRLEIPRGRFERRVDLPPGNYTLRRRELEHGVLVLCLARR